MKHSYKHLIAAAVLSAVGLVAVAQTPSAPAEHRSAMGHRSQGSADGAQMQERMARMQTRMAQHLAEFKQQLQLSPGQEAAWNTYTEALKPGNMTRIDRAEVAKLTTPERIDRMKAHRDARMAAMDRRGEATKAFYAILTPEQKKTFDEQSLRRGHHGRGGDGHHGRHHKG